MSLTEKVLSGGAAGAAQRLGAESGARALCGERRRSPAVAALTAGIALVCGSAATAALAAEHNLAATMPTYMASQSAPAVRTVIGPVEGYGCAPQRDHPLDVSVQQSDALDQLRVRALKAGANGVINVSFEPIHTDHRNQCYQGLAAKGQAVVLNTP